MERNELEKKEGYCTAWGLGREEAAPQTVREKVKAGGDFSIFYLCRTTFLSPDSKKFLF